MEDRPVCRWFVGEPRCLFLYFSHACIFFFPASWPVAYCCLFLFFQRMLLSFLFSYAFPLQMLTLFLPRRGRCVGVCIVVTADKAFRHSVMQLNHFDSFTVV